MEPSEETLDWCSSWNHQIHIEDLLCARKTHSHMSSTLTSEKAASRVRISGRLCGNDLALHPVGSDLALHPVGSAGGGGGKEP